MEDLPPIPTRAARLKFARDKTGLSQIAAGERIGVSGAAVSGWERGGELTSPNLSKVASVYGVPVDWIMHGRSGSGRGFVQGRRVPVVSNIKAGGWSPAWQAYEPGDAGNFLYTEIDCSEDVFALTISGNSMEPEFLEGDKVIIDPREKPRPGDYVAAKLKVEDEATFKKYRPTGGGLIELVPLNTDWPVLTMTPDQGFIIGTMIEHRKYPKLRKR